MTSYSKLAIGAAQFGYEYGIANKTGQPKLEEVKDILKIAYCNGINTIDTAMTYGESESILGKAGISQFNIITKIPPVMNNSQEWLEDKIQTSFENLKIKNLYGILFHDSADLLGQNGPSNLNTLLRLKEEGIVRKIGVSIYDPNELEQIWRLFRPDIIQTPYNLIDRRIEKSGWLEKLYMEEVEIHVRSIFLQGLLLMSHNTIPFYFHRWENLWKKWYSFLDQNKLSPIKACLNLVCSKKEISRVIIGFDTCHQLLEIVSNYPLINDEIKLDFMNSDDPLLINPFLWHK